MSSIKRWFPVAHHFVIFWFLVAMVLGVALGNGASPYLSAALIMATVAGLLIHSGVSPDEWGSMATAFYNRGPEIAGVGCIAYIFVVTVWYTVWLPSMTLLAAAVAHTTLTSLVGLGGLGCLGIGVVITAWRTGPAVDLSLLSRMVVSLLMLSVLTVVFVTALWRLIEVFAWFWLSVVGIGDDVGTVIDTIVSAYPAFTIPRHSTPTHEAFIATAIVFGGFVVVALWNLRGNTPLTRADATLASATEYPTLHAMTTTISAQLDIPTPAIAVTDRSDPQAVVMGVRPGTATFLVSQGLLDALDSDELEAVIAHELAHVANMDAIVMGILTLPKRLVDMFDGTLDEDEEGPPPTSDAVESTGGRGSILITIVRLPIVAVGYCLGAIALRIIPVMILSLIATSVFIATLSQPAVAVLSRARESAADRTAVRVTGSPAALASALHTLDEHITPRPSTDLRDATPLSSLSILPLDPIDPPPDSPDTERVLATLIALLSGDRKTENLWTAIEAGLTRLWWLLFATHPPTTHRIAALTALTDEEQAGS